MFCSLGTARVMGVPSGSSTSPKDQTGLQHIGRPLQVQNDIVVGVGALRERDYR
jgi:hypothetical protein